MCEAKFSLFHVVWQAVKFSAGLSETCKFWDENIKAIKLISCFLYFFFNVEVLLEARTGRNCTSGRDGLFVPPAARCTVIWIC